MASVLNMGDSSIYIAVLLAVPIVYAFLKGLYNVYFHPLSTFPGPRLAAATKIPIAVVSWNGTLSHWLRDLHQRYSTDVVRISPDELSFISPSAWEDLCGHRQGRPSFPRDLRVYAGVNSILTANDADHNRMRRLLSHAFSNTALKEQEALIRVQVEILINGLRKQIEGPSKGKVDLSDWYHWTTFDVIGDLAFGESFHCLSDTNYHPWVAMLMSYLKFVVFLSVTLRFPPLQRLLRLFVSNKALQARADHDRLAAEKVERRMKTATTRPDFLSYILAHNNEKGRMTREEIHENVATFISAGSETTAASLNGITWFLLQNRDCLTRLNEEIRAAFRTRDEINVQKIGELKYLQAVVTESFRIYPSALAGQPRRAPGEGDTVSGYWVPGGTGIQINQYAAYHSHHNFSNPSAFVPERWLGDPRFDSDKKDVLQPFSVGARNCIGKNLAMAEIRLVIVRMLWEFDMELCAETGSDWAEKKAWFTWDKRPLFVKLAART
ncbi:hypothetical protein HO173_006836 [Letharia columbiana]|uniref:Cytochrome P450 n=1 Tax=Letharia columbiana TaxID=112416 RepID=A0A8H6L470_9LECA|nr:uncharacterized protein HO173_006836 [Letharia columbiana]KAF6234906.1 hypothetical protein HO173_006836 [Letharia columbiana]